jgi:nucleoside-diphosphate kinase
MLKHDFVFIRSKELHLSLKEAEDFYQEHAGRFFFNRLTHFMSSSPIYVHIIGKGNAITEWRKLMGPTKVTKTQYELPDSIRGTFGITDTRNVAHGSDSLENCLREISFFFPEFDPLYWSQSELPQLLLENQNHVPCNSGESKRQ